MALIIFSSMSIARAKLLRRIRAAGWAAGAYVLHQLFAFPAVVWRVDGHWTWAPFAIFPKPSPNHSFPVSTISPPVTFR